MALVNNLPNVAHQKPQRLNPEERRCAVHIPQSLDAEIQRYLAAQYVAGTRITKQQFVADACRAYLIAMNH